jgi:hypothetical protein
MKTTSSDMYPWFSIFMEKSNNCPYNCVLLTSSFMKMVSSLKFLKQTHTSVFVNSEFFSKNWNWWFSNSEILKNQNQRFFINSNHTTLVLLIPCMFINQSFGVIIWGGWEGERIWQPKGIGGLLLAQNPLPSRTSHLELQLGRARAPRMLAL